MIARKTNIPTIIQFRIENIIKKGKGGFTLLLFT